MKLWKEFRAECAHRLPMLPPDHKCARLHGHSYLFRLHVEGEVDPHLGWVTDFGAHLKACGDMIVGLIDHRYLNDIDGLENPTAERLAVWIWERAALGLPHSVQLVAVEVQETCTAGVRYEG